MGMGKDLVAETMSWRRKEGDEIEEGFSCGDSNGAWSATASCVLREEEEAGVLLNARRWRWRWR